MKHKIRYHGGNTLSYTDYGKKNGFPILIQHGSIASITDYDLFELLVKLENRLICIARPGYGESSSYIMDNIAEWGDVVSGLIDDLKLTHFDILGMSSGAPYSYAIGYQFPEKVRNIYILSGTPALYDDHVLSYWPYEVKKNASILEMQKLAYELFFSTLSEEDLSKDDVKDSMMNECFGIAQDFKLRCVDWGFKLSEMKANVLMQHSRDDPSIPLITAEITSKLLPNCRLIIKEGDVHFSKALLEDFMVLWDFP